MHITMIEEGCRIPDSAESFISFILSASRVLLSKSEVMIWFRAAIHESLSGKKSYLSCEMQQRVLKVIKG